MRFKNYILSIGISRLNDVFSILGRCNDYLRVWYLYICPMSIVLTFLQQEVEEIVSCAVK